MNLIAIPGVEFPQQCRHFHLVFGHNAKGSFDGHRVGAAYVEAHVVDEVATVEGHVRFVLIVEKLI